jgi:four helix bundle protein
MPRNRVGDVLGRQVLRSGVSIGANYREALRASSTKHFISIVEIALRETDETLYWLELVQESGTVKPARLESLKKECSELVAIFVATVRSSKER